MTSVLPSILASDFARLADECHRAEDAGADALHVDVMDGHYVRNITIGPLIVEAIRRSTALPLNTHLMIDNPELYVEDFVRAGSDCVLVHPEAKGDPALALEYIREAGRKRGIALNPETPVSAAGDMARDVEFFLVMSVNPGWGGQEFMPHVLKKFAEALEVCGSGTEFGIDGGINLQSGADAVKAGCDCLIAGTFLFHAEDMPRRVAQLRELGKES